MALPSGRETRFTQGWRREAGRTLTKKEREERRPSAFNLLHILPFWLLHSFPKELCKILSNPYSSLLQHVKQLHGQKHGQRAIGAKNKKNTLQSFNNNNKICAWALLIPPPASGGCDPSAAAPAQCSSGRFPTDFFYLSHGHTQCCSSSEGNHPFFPSRRCCGNAWLRKRRLSTTV